MSDIFLDGNSTTPGDPRVVRALCSSYRRHFGNASSQHKFGWRAKCLLEQARKNISIFLGAERDEVSFIPSVTIGLNVGILGFLGSRPGSAKRIAASRVEHKSIVSIIRYACRLKGWEWVELEHDNFGAIIPQSVGEAARRGVDLICLSHGNGEIGSLNDINQIVSEAGGDASLIVDASQTAAYLSLPRIVDLLLFSGHKLYGPRGIAALRKRRGIELGPVLLGAGQEGGLVPGTEDVPSAIALGVAARIAARELNMRREHVSSLCDFFWKFLVERVSDVELNGPLVGRLPGNLSLTIPGVPAELLMRHLPHLGFSMASACTGPSESPVLRALGFSKMRISRTFRVGFNAFNTHDEVEEAARDIAVMINRLRRPKQ